jgi:hypothetical protein
MVDCKLAALPEEVGNWAGEGEWGVAGVLEGAQCDEKSNVQTCHAPAPSVNGEKKISMQVIR